MNRRYPSPNSILLCMGFLAFTSQVFGDSLTVRFSDPQGDNSGAVDVLSMDITFDNLSGDYVVDVLADAAEPFIGNCLLNVNIWNPDAGTVFADTFPGIDNLNCPTGRHFTLEGTNAVLLGWQAGDKVASSSGTDLGNPPGTILFRSSVVDLIGGAPVNCGSPFPNICEEDAIAAQNVFTIQEIISIDIKPNSQDNSINLRSRGNVPVAVLTTDSFDATQVDWKTVRFGPGNAVETHERSHVVDVDGDGQMDTVLHFKTYDSGIRCGDTLATLTGETFIGEALIGTDAISTVKCSK